MRIMYPYCTIYNAMLNREIMKITLFVSTSEVPAELYACYTHEIVGSSLVVQTEQLLLHMQLPKNQRAPT